jgi:hypothetical protein
MAEMTWTTMHIGGAIPENRIDELVEIISSYFHDAQDIPEDEDAVRAVIAKNESLFIQGSVNYGNPEELKDFCQQYGLPYWCHFDAGYEWDAGINIWRPGFEKEEDCAASAQGYTPDVTLGELRLFAKQGETLADVIAHAERFTAEAVPPLTIGAPVADEAEAEVEEDPIGAIAPDGTRLDHWDERLRAAGCTPVYRDGGAP